MILIINNFNENVHLGDLDGKRTGELCQKISGQEFMVKRYFEVSGEFLEEHPEIKGVVLGGCNCSWDHLYFDIFDGEFDLIRKSRVPVLGICGGHQLMAMAYGGSARRADFGKEERHFTRMKIVKESPITEGIPDEVYAFQYHNCMVPELPEGFELLVTGEKTVIQAMGKTGEHKYGVQFHPELDHEAADPLFRAEDPSLVNGQQVLTNFLKLCR